MKKLNQKGGLDPIVVIIVIVVLALSGYVAWMLLGGQNSESSIGTSQNQESTEDQTEVVYDGETKLIETDCYTIQIPAEQYAEESIESCRLVVKTFDSYYTDMSIISDATAEYEESVNEITELTTKAIEEYKADNADRTETSNGVSLDELPKISKTTVDGLEATVFDSIRADSGLAVRFVVINTDQEYEDPQNGDILKTFVAFGYYYNEGFRNSFDSMLQSLEFKQSNIE